MDKLPKVLLIGITELFDSQDLLHWNIGSNINGSIAVSMRFGLAGHDSSTPVSARRKTPGQVRRDYERSEC